MGTVYIQDEKKQEEKKKPYQLQNIKQTLIGPPVIPKKITKSTTILKKHVHVSPDIKKSISTMKSQFSGLINLENQNTFRKSRESDTTNLITKLQKNHQGNFLVSVPNILPPLRKNSRNSSVERYSPAPVKQGNEVLLEQLYRPKDFKLIRPNETMMKKNESLKKKIKI